LAKVKKQEENDKINENLEEEKEQCEVVEELKEITGD